jgi:hypothetical protein
MAGGCTSGRRQRFEGRRGVQHLSDALGGVGEPGDGQRRAAVGEAPQRWESCGAGWSWVSPSPGLTHG